MREYEENLEKRPAEISLNGRAMENAAVEQQKGVERLL